MSNFPGKTVPGNTISGIADFRTGTYKPIIPSLLIDDESILYGHPRITETRLRLAIAGRIADSIKSTISGIADGRTEGQIFP